MCTCLQINKDWFVPIFENTLYMKVDKLRKAPEINEIEVARMIQLLGLKRNQTILDLCCGYGRVSTLLGTCGYRVIGLDLSLPLLAEAKKRSYDLDSKITYIQGNMNYIPLRNLDVVFCVNTAFGYFLEYECNLKTLRCIYEALKPGGKFLLEQRNIYILDTRQLIEEDYFLKNDTIRFIKVSNICLQHGVWSGFYEYRYHASNYKKKYFFRIRLYKAGEIKEMLRFAGFNPKYIRFYGDYDGSTFNEEESIRLLVVSEKAF